MEVLVWEPIDSGTKPSFDMWTETGLRNCIQEQLKKLDTIPTYKVTLKAWESLLSFSSTNRRISIDGRPIIDYLGICYFEYAPEIKSEGCILILKGLKEEYNAI